MKNPHSLQTDTNIPKQLLRVGTWCLIIGACVFSISRFIPWFFGPVLETNITNGAVLENPLLTISGTGKHTQTISINDTPITLSPAGLFTTNIVLQPGINQFTLNATDKFGKEKKQNYTLIVKEKATNPSFASNTLPTTTY